MVATSSPDRSAEGKRIVIFGAGLIGCYIGGRLAAAGADVTLIGRAATLNAIRERGLRLTDIKGFDTTVPASRLSLSEDASALAGASLVILTVKSMGTAAAAAEIARHAPNAIVLSFQNGVSNAEVLRAALPGAIVVAGMVPYNVSSPEPGHYHQGTGGELYAGREPELTPFVPAFTAAGLPLTLHENMTSVLWGKLVVNLNNAINALSGIPLAAELSQRDFRRALSRCQVETLGILRRARIKPADVLGLPIRLMPYALNLPTWIYRRVMARQGFKVDRHARSSMAEDLAAHRPTEVDYLNGEVVNLAHRVGRQAPINERVVELIHAAERGGQPWKAKPLLIALKGTAKARNIKIVPRRGA